MIPDGVRRQALHPFSELPHPAGFRTVVRDGFTASLHPMPFAQIVDAGALDPGDVPAAIDEARELVREHGRSLLIWLVTPEVRSVGAELERHGLVHTDTPGFEATENAMALTRRPDGPAPDGVAVAEVASFEEYAASQLLAADVFEMTPAMRADLERALPDRWAEYSRPDNPLRQFNATIDGRLVGTAAAGLGSAGANLFGGSVHPDARGRGVYRALTLARWELAVANGTPALTIQAGRMSKPIAERLGFELVGTIDVYVDDFS